MREKSSRDSVARDSFLQRLRDSGFAVEPESVIARDNVYRVNRTAHLLVRTSRFHSKRNIYFFGLTRHIFEHFAQLPHPIIAFVLADTSEALLVPARWIWERRASLSADYKQFKLEIDKHLRLKTPRAKHAFIDLSAFREQFGILNTTDSVVVSPAESKTVSSNHSNLQGMLLHIGNLRGFDTFTPNRSPQFNKKALGETATVRTPPQFPGLNNEIIRQIDVIWLDKSFPVHAFEIELTTGIWSGLVRLGELRRLSTVLHVVTGTDEKAFKRRIAGDIFRDILERCHHATSADVERLYESEIQVAELRKRVAV